ncbi:MAG TPA: GAF domain-containing sensor histidine kinase [Rhizomicrobium sp.]|nr:GAF domain-containing sensor histidine kinase [Rhizomicrobium sp.]
MVADYTADIDAIGRVAAVPTILDVVCRTTGMGFAAVARVTSDRWIACSVRDEIAFGLKPGGELKVETTICHEIRQSGEAVIIDHVAEDAAWRAHHTPLQYGFQSYISMPIVLGDGTFFGTLCAIDPKPAKLRNPATIGMFKLFADLIAFHLDANARLEASEATLSDERRTAELREQFIAVLGHDLRNPLASISGGIRLLQRDNTPPDKAKTIAAMMQDSVTRMAGLIDNVLDFARGRLGGGFALERKDVDLAPVLHHVVAELSSGARAIETRIDLPAPVNADRARIAQLLSNLLGNALTHGASDKPVTVTASAANGVFELAVSNAGAPIPPAALAKLFQPFTRGAITPGHQGLGLGLYIASEIANAHGGTLTATSTPDETRFVFRMPPA